MHAIGPEVLKTIDGLITAARSFHERGWMLGTSGNLSARLSLPEPAIAITGSGTSKGLLTYSDIVVLPEEKRQGLGFLGTQRACPSAETVIHQAIYSSSLTVGAVIHAHTTASTVLSRASAVGDEPWSIEVEGLEMLKGLKVSWCDEALRTNFPVLPNHHDMTTIARRVEDLVDNRSSLPAVLIVGHGLTVWGDTLEQACNHLEAAEFVCQVLREERLK